MVTKRSSASVENSPSHEKSTQPMVLNIPETLDDEVKILVESKWPIVLAHCPGLNLYSASLGEGSIRSNFSYAPEHAQRVTVEFEIPNDDRLIPYAANGHTCQYEISRNGQQLSIPKSVCAEVCLDRGLKPGESDMKLPLVN